MAKAQAQAAVAVTEPRTLKSQFGYVDGGEGRQLLHLPVAHMTVEKHQLRGAQRDEIEYDLLRDSIRNNGILLTLLVREAPDLIPPGEAEMRYRVVDGTQRFSCAQDLGFETIPCHVVNMTDAEVADAQIIANRNNLETKPFHYTEQLHRMLLANPTLTVPELAKQLHCPPSFLEARLSLRKLDPSLGQLLDEGKIIISNALHLAKCDVETQKEFAEQAMTMKVQEFGGIVQQRLNELKAARREGRAPRKEGFQPTARLRKPKDLKPMVADPSAYRGQVEHLCAVVGATTAVQGFFAALNYVLHLDPEQVESDKAADAQKKQTKLAESSALAAEKARIRAQQAREAARKAGLIPDDEAQAQEPDDDSELDEDEDEE